jgi:hypothetical protein
VVRDRDSWMRSMVGDFSKSTNAIRRLVYEVPHPQLDPEAYLARYDRHNREVQAYFAGREDDFISLDLAKGEVGWERVCDFLGHPVPDRRWPHANKKHVKQMRLLLRRNRNRLRRLLGAR